MFYAHEILRRHHGKLGLIWLAACQPKFLKRLKTFAVSLNRLSKDLSEELAHGLGGRASLRSSLRLCSKLVSGLWLLYRRKCKALREYADKMLQLLDERSKMGLHLR
ncbi:meiotic recombination protein REC8 homolog isoform X2 [Ixodes scapularis]